VGGMRIRENVDWHIDPEILIIDKVLVVEDAAFQKKWEVSIQGTHRNHFKRI
jgi:ABC-type polysaccharide/polyol phosphate transport system ATPase subunit